LCLRRPGDGERGKCADNLGPILHRILPPVLFTLCASNVPPTSNYIKHIIVTAAWRRAVPCRGSPSAPSPASPVDR
jgi:hypothetical protein